MNDDASLTFVVKQCEGKIVYGDCSPLIIVDDMNRKSLFHASSVSFVHWDFSRSFKVYIKASCIAC